MNPKINKTYRLGLKTKWTVKTIVYFLNAIVNGLDSWFPDPKVEDRY